MEKEKSERMGARSKHTGNNVAEMKRKAERHSFKVGRTHARKRRYAEAVERIEGAENGGERIGRRRRRNVIRVAP